MTGTIEPHDVVDCIADLQQRFPGAEVCFVRRMPHGLRWCVDDNIIYVRNDPANQPGLDVAEALTQLDGYRPTLIALDGGRQDDDDGEWLTGLG